MSHLKYKYILFDWDGTLAKTLDVWIDAYKSVASELNIDLTNFTDNQIVETFFGREAQGFKQFGVDDLDSVYARIKKYVDVNVVNVEIYKGVKETLRVLTDKGCKLALHTSSNKNLLYPAIVNNDLEKYFDYILTRDDVKNPKPDPEIIYKELEYFKADKKDVLIVGDSNGDIDVSRNSGVDCALFYPEANKKFYKEEFLTNLKPKFVLHDLLELLDIIK